MEKEKQLLKLRAKDKVDLDVISSCMQDAIIPVGAMQFDQAGGIFRLISTRFCWECQPERRKGKEYFQRVRTVVSFHQVNSVKYRRLNKEDPSVLLELLNMSVLSANDIYLYFSGGGEISLSIGQINCFMQDIPEIFWTRSRPVHKIA